MYLYVFQYSQFRGKKRASYNLTVLLLFFSQLFGLGVANIFGSFFSAYPSTGEI